MRPPAGGTANREALRLYREVLRTGELRARGGARGPRSRRTAQAGPGGRQKERESAGARARAAAAGAGAGAGDAVRGGCDVTQRMYYPTVGAEETFF